MNEADIKELGERNELLLREMERFDRLTKTIQKLVGAEVEQFKKNKGDPFKHNDLATNLYGEWFIVKLVFFFVFFNYIIY